MGLSRSANEVGGLHRRRVVSDRDVPAVVGVVGAVGRLGVGRDVTPGGDLVGGENALLVALDSERGTDVEDVGGTALALELVDRVELVLAGAVRVRVGDLDSVLGGEVLHDRAVVGPVGGQRDDVELAFLLGRGDKGGHAAARFRGRGGGPVGSAAGAAAAAGTRRAASGREQQAAGNGGSSRHGVPCAHYSLPSTVPGTRDSRSQILARQVEIMTSQDKREVSSPWRPGIRYQSGS